MPGQMPPQGGQGQASPQGPQGAPAQGGPQAQQGGAQGGGAAISSLLTNVDKAIDHLNVVIGQSKATSPQDKQLIGQIDQLYGKLMQSLSGSGDQDDQDGQDSSAQGQSVPQEAGGNAGAVPSY